MSMSAQQSAPERRVDADGVTRIAQRRRGAGTWVLAGAAAVTVVCLVLAAWLTLSAPELRPSEEWGPEEPARPAQAVAAPVRSAPAVRQVRVAAPQASMSEQVRMAREAAAQETEASAGALDAGSAPVERSGLALFPAPGTDPLKEGLLVPEDFELPPGYMRHYQVTDDGQQLPAILMFHPDYKPKDEQGRPIPIPEDLIVPPELAPPGLPLEMLDVHELQGGSEPAP